jgi:hypothetical protein
MTDEPWDVIVDVEIDMTDVHPHGDACETPECGH